MRVNFLQEFCLAFLATSDNEEHGAITPGIRVQAKKRRSVLDQKRRKLEREIKAGVHVDGSSSSEMTQMKALLKRVTELEKEKGQLEKENGQLRGKVQKLESANQEQAEHATRPQLNASVFDDEFGLGEMEFDSELAGALDKLMAAPTEPSGEDSDDSDLSFLDSAPASVHGMLQLTPRSESFGISPRFFSQQVTLKRTRSGSLADALRQMESMPQKSKLGISH